MGLLKITAVLFMLWELTKTESGITCRKDPASRGTELFTPLAIFSYSNQSGTHAHCMPVIQYRHE